MFARVINKIFKRSGASAPKEEAARKAEALFGRSTAVPAEPAAPEAPPAKERRQAKPATPAQAGGTTADAVKKAWEAKAGTSLKEGATNEELCGITASMSREEIRSILATLYRRHNRAASSLDSKLRDEAEIMLEAIAAMKEKYLGG